MVDVKARMKVYSHTLNSKIKNVIKQNLAFSGTAEGENGKSFEDTGPIPADLEAGV